MGTESIDVGQTPQEASPQTQRPAVPDRGVDARPERRPGVPMDWEPPHPVEGAHWREPSPMPPSRDVTRRMELGGRLTPVYGTAQPPRGLSGLVRRAAYRIPDHEAKHWMMLLLADRIDVVEHGRGPTKWIALAAPALLAIAAVRLASVRRRRSMRRLLRAAAW